LEGEEPSEEYKYGGLTSCSCWLAQHEANLSHSISDNKKYVGKMGKSKRKEVGRSDRYILSLTEHTDNEALLLGWESE
jgi:hypothetical protein